MKTTKRRDGGSRRGWVWLPTLPAARASTLHAGSCPAHPGIAHVERPPCDASSNQSARSTSISRTRDQALQPRKGRPTIARGVSPWTEKTTKTAAPEGATQDVRKRCVCHGRRRIDAAPGSSIRVAASRLKNVDRTHCADARAMAKGTHGGPFPKNHRPCYVYEHCRLR